MLDGEPGALTAEFGAAAALNATTGLLFLAQAVLIAAGAGGALPHIWLEAAMRACSGQHQDVTRSSTADLTFGDALDITRAKSGSLVAGVCRLGAAAAGADLARQALYARFGSLLGVVAQLANDIRAIEGHAHKKTDLLLSRPTLPLTYAAHLGLAPNRAPAAPAPAGPTGAGHFTWAVAETHRRQAQRLIPALTRDSASRQSLAGLLAEL